MNRFLLGALALVLALPSPSSAQRPDRGDYSVAVALFDTGTGTVFSGGRMFTDQIHGAIEFTYRRANAEDNPSSPTVGISAEANTGEWSVGPTIRYYGPQSGPVVPYLRAKFAFGNAISDLRLAQDQVRDEDTFTLEGSLAIGGEWFPVKGIGVSGHTGFQFARASLERLNENGDLLERTTDNYGTFRSSLTFSFYFQ